MTSLRRRSVAAPVSLVHGLAMSFRTTTVLTVMILLSTAALASLLLGVLQPRVADYSALTRDLRVAHEGMLDQDTGTRAWVATGDPRFLEAVRTGQSILRAANTDLVGRLGVDQIVDRGILDVRLTQQAWIDGWANPALASSPPSDDASRDTEMAAGKLLFDRYRDAYAIVIEEVAGRRDRALLDQRSAMVAWAAIELVLLTGMLAASHHNRRRMERAVVGPLDDLLRTMARIRDGDLRATPAFRTTQELNVLGDGLVEMTAALSFQQETILAREAEVAGHASHLREILVLARDIAGSLSVRYVAESSAFAARSVANADRCVIWLLDDASTLLTAVHDTSLARGQVPSLAEVALGGDVVGDAARDARTCVLDVEGGSRRAMPLVVGARVVGVLELHLGAEDVAPAIADVLETLAIHAGAALEAARLHHAADELSSVDGLTRLLNRHRLEEDLRTECARSLRYGRPLGFVMLDVDQFKSLNDVYGHQHGDQVLQQLAEVLTAAVRESDTVYRYGGEELAIIVRDGDRDEAARLAERVRLAIELAFSTGSGNPRAVTASFGVAAIPFDASSPEALVAAADRALYEAKATGRNRVSIAEPNIAGV